MPVPIIISLTCVLVGYAGVLAAVTFACVLLGMLSWAAAAALCRGDWVRGVSRARVMFAL